MKELLRRAIKERTINRTILSKDLRDLRWRNYLQASQNEMRKTQVKEKKKYLELVQDPSRQPALSVLHEEYAQDHTVKLQKGMTSWRSDEDFAATRGWRIPDLGHALRFHPLIFLFAQLAEPFIDLRGEDEARGHSAA